jgi:hypothetical protein
MPAVRFERFNHSSLLIDHVRVAADVRRIRIPGGRRPIASSGIGSRDLRAGFLGLAVTDDDPDGKCYSSS